MGRELEPPDQLGTPLLSRRPLRAGGGGGGGGGGSLVETGAGGEEAGVSGGGGMKEGPAGGPEHEDVEGVACGARRRTSAQVCLT